MGGPAVGPGQMLVLAPGLNTDFTHSDSPLTVLSQGDMLIIPIARLGWAQVSVKANLQVEELAVPLVWSQDAQSVAGTVQALVLWGPLLQCRLWRAAGRPCLRP